MHCPFCSHEETQVVETRDSDEGDVIRRRRRCLKCDKRFTTYERTQLEPLMVVKRDGRKEPFNPDKLLRGLLLACEKRPVSEEVLRRFAYTFEDQVSGPEITSEEIGLKALAFLKELDHVAYIRFASVYREFDSVERFIEEIRSLASLDKKEGD